MKRQQYLGCLLASCVLILTACGTVQPISGQVVERTTEEDGTLSAFVVETHTGERISLTMTEKTRVFSWVDGVSGQDFAAGTLDGIAVSVVTGDRQMSLPPAATVFPPMRPRRSRYPDTAGRRDYIIRRDSGGDLAGKPGQPL